MFCVNFLTLVVAAPIFHEDVHVGELGADTLGICVGFVNLGDGKDHGYASGLGVVDGLDGLRHHSIVSGHHDDTQVRDLGTTGTHGGEGLVTRGVQERDLTTVGKTYLVSTDVLCDTGNDVGLADVVLQRGLTMVNVTHDCNDGVTRLQIFFAINLLIFRIFSICTDKLHLESEFFCQQGDGLGIQSLVDGDEKTNAHTG